MVIDDLIDASAYTENKEEGQSLVIMLLCMNESSI